MFSYVFCTIFEKVMDIRCWFWLLGHCTSSFKVQVLKLYWFAVPHSN